MDFLRELRNKNAPLFWAGIGSFVLLFLFLGLYMFDDQRVMGVNAWVKPIKFALSIGVYFLTFAWLMDMVGEAKRSVRIIPWGVIISMVIVVALVVIQAARGVRSHFNMTSVPDVLIYAALVLALAVNMIFNIWTLVLLYSVALPVAKAMQLAVRAGLWLFILGSAAGVLMVSNFGHTVGMSDGGPGLFFLNWSTDAGDLRAAHFFGMLALQVIPLSAFLMEKKNMSHSKFWIYSISLLYLLFLVGVLMQALNGTPFSFLIY